MTDATLDVLGLAASAWVWFGVWLLMRINEIMLNMPRIPKAKARWRR